MKHAAKTDVFGAPTQPHRVATRGRVATRAALAVSGTVLSLLAACTSKSSDTTTPSPTPTNHNPTAPTLTVGLVEDLMPTEPEQNERGVRTVVEVNVGNETPIYLGHADTFNSQGEPVSMFQGAGYPLDPANGKADFYTLPFTCDSVTGEGLDGEVLIDASASYSSQNLRETFEIQEMVSTDAICASGSKTTTAPDGFSPSLGF